MATSSTSAKATGLQYSDAEQVHTPGLWRYAVNHGPDGETGWANVYDSADTMVGNFRTHHAIRIVRAVNAYDEMRKALEPFAQIPLWRDQYPDAKIDEPMDQRLRGYIKPGDVRAARAALSQAHGEGGD